MLYFFQWYILTATACNRWDLDKNGESFLSGKLLDGTVFCIWSVEKYIRLDFKNTLDTK